MTLEQAWKSVLATAQEMNARYGDVVFDELAIVSIADKQPRTLSYQGPRQTAFTENFPRDSAALRQTVRQGGLRYEAGDFEFSHEGVGTGFEAFMVLGKGVCLICNHTVKTMQAISQNPRWIAAQVPFAELGEKFRAAPLVLSPAGTVQLQPA